MREKRKRGEARIKRGGSGASRTGLSGAQGQTRPSVSKRQFGSVETKGSFAKKRPEHAQKPVCRGVPAFEKDSLVTNVNMWLCIDTQRNGGNGENYVVGPNGNKIRMGLNNVKIVCYMPYTEENHI